MALAAGLTLSACAGRDPQPIATVQPQDQFADCTMIRAEIEANNAKVKELADEQGWKAAQNVVTGVGGIFTFGLTWFGMDFKGAAAKDAAELDARQKYLTELATQRCAPGYRPPQAPYPYIPPPPPGGKPSKKPATAAPAAPPEPEPSNG
jgi:hypothetical protein